MRVAVTSSDGRFVDLHFGKAERFMIYEIDGDGDATFIGDVQVPAYCAWPARLIDASDEHLESIIGEMRECAEATAVHHMMPDKLAAIAAAVSGCDSIVTAMIGDAPREEMERHGFDVFTITGPVELSLKELSKMY